MSVKVKEGAEGGILGAVGKKNSNLNMFGSSHNVVGESSSDLILRTRGKIKIQWGNKFIDLLKDGKLNVNSDFIFKVADKDSIKNKTGVYVTDNGEVYLKYSSDEPLNLQGEIGTSYVSFLAPQETTSDNKYTALKNIGLIYSSLEEVDEKSLQNGIIYIESTQKLYYIKDGNLQEYTFKIPNPITEQFIISKSDDNNGSLLILGDGIKNSLAFNNLYIYNTTSDSVFDSKLPISFKIKNTEVVKINPEQTEINNTLINNNIQSSNANSDFGFRLYMSNNKSILEVDSLIVRSESTNLKYPEYWFLDNNIIKSIDNNIITFYYKNNYKVGDILRYYVLKEDTTEEEDVDSVSSYQAITVQVTEITDTSVTVQSSSDAEVDDVANVFIFKISDVPIRIKSNNIDLVEKSFEDQEIIHTRIGNIGELFEDVEDVGIYSDNAIFKTAQYTSDYNLDNTDSSTKLASTEWVQQHLSETNLPIGAIIMFNGESNKIPNNWHICDGTEGTPNLIDNFIKASNVTGSSDTIRLNKDPLSSDTWDLTYYSLIFIMKIK